MVSTISNSVLCSVAGECWTADDAEVQVGLEGDRFLCFIFTVNENFSSTVGTFPIVFRTQELPQLHNKPLAYDVTSSNNALTDVKGILVIG